MFGLRLIPASTGDEAELTLGGYDASKTTKDLRFAKIIDPDVTPNFWSLESCSIEVNNQSSSYLGTPIPIIFDSGTSNIVFSISIIEAVYSIISPKILPHGTLGVYGIPCSEIDSKADITF
ncbi:hypothetical protein M422DRAFT_46520 [Sphaerobolus stellatus SS14]|uniref:Peptidase A1 domain-containing protein n=1 Tax=Sphaerobolus stellatus (strain SS14) TaxID=990650 RepID=A0A0C9W3Z7_SPHS4|nr:hypothetical protein M422DRAFT_46520 [Sphaerobolus stellatus SS14]